MLPVPSIPLFGFHFDYWFLSGCGYESKKKYLFGEATVQIKLVEGDSAGIVTAFYVKYMHSYSNPKQI